MPTLIPRLDPGSISEDGAPGGSPRGGESASGIPPTWTPRPEQELATPLPAPDSSGSDGPETAEEPAAEDQYVVQAGDTLAEIAEEFGVDLERLAQANNIEDVDRIEVGQVLVIPR